MNEAINFTQHLLPDGRLHETFISRPPEIDPAVWSATYVLAERIRKAGYSFHAEMLRDYSTISFTVVGYSPIHEEESDIAIVIAPNGPSIPSKVVELVESAASILAKWNILND